VSTGDFAEEVAAQAIALAQAAGVPLLVVLGLLLVASLLLVAAKHLPALKWPKADPPVPPEPPAEWNQDPAAGAVVKPGPPGGSSDEVQSG
jgi:hypothetical protein